MGIRRSAVLALALGAAMTGLAGVADAAFHVLPQQKLLDRGCDTAVPGIQKMVNEAWARQIRTVRAHVRVLRPGRLLGDIAFNPSGDSLGVAADGAAGGTVDFGCGSVVAGDQNGSGSAESFSGPGLPKKHVVAVVRETVTKAGRYTLTFTLNQKGRRILARLGAEQRAYRKHHPHGGQPPTITWGIGLHFAAGG